MQQPDLKKTIEIVLINTLIILSIIPLLPLKGIAAIFGSILFLATLILCLKNHTYIQQPAKQDRVLVYLFFSSPFLAIAISQILRQNLDVKAFDGPIRFVFAVPLFIYILNNKFDFTKIITWSIPTSLILLFIYVFAFDQTRDNQLISLAHGHRLTVKHLDAIIFGNYAIILAFCCLFSINKRTEKPLLFLLITGFTCGTTLSILSQSRAGWIAGLCLSLLLILFNRKVIQSHKKLSFFIFIFLSLVFLATLLTTNIVSTRIFEAIKEINLWISGTETFTSTGIRLSMWKLSTYLFSLNPLSGYGDKNFDPSFLTNEVFLAIGHKGGVETIYCCGPHNELLGHMLRSGIFGIIAYFFIYLTPLNFFLRFRNSLVKRQAAMIGICFVTGMLITGLSSEMLSLKFTFTFYVLIMSILLGQCLRNET